MWNYILSKEAKKDFNKLDASQKAQLISKIRKVKQNPLPLNKGGKGIPLGNKYGYNLTGYLEVKHRGLGLRAIYKLIDDEMIMLFIAIGNRKDEEVYKAAYNRLID